MSYTEKGDLEHSEAKCFTKSVEIIQESPGSRSASQSKNLQTENKNKKDLGSSSGFKVRDLGKIVQLDWAQEQGCLGGLSGIGLEEGYECDNVIKPGETLKDPNVPRGFDLNIAAVTDLEGGFQCNDVIKPDETLKDRSLYVPRDFDLNIAAVTDLEGLSVIDLEGGFECDDVIKPDETLKDPSPNLPRDFDLNIASLPDLNEELAPLFEFSGDGDKEDVSRDIKNNGLARSHGSDDSRNWVQLNSTGGTCGKRSAGMIGDTHSCNSILVNGSSSNISNGFGCLDQNFEYCVDKITWLECEGHIKQEFRLNFLTWFSLRSTEQQRRVVHTYIQTMIAKPVSLAAQLVDSFSEIISSKRPKTDFCNK